jgi:hypothetical protein
MIARGSIETPRNDVSRMDLEEDGLRVDVEFFFHRGWVFRPMLDRCMGMIEPHDTHDGSRLGITQWLMATDVTNCFTSFEKREESIHCKLMASGRYDTALDFDLGTREHGEERTRLRGGRDSVE